jgi:hypothetical protein
MKGFLYTIEVLIAVSIVFIPIVLIFSTLPVKPTLETSIMKTQGFDALDYLNTKGDLRKMMIEKNETGIEQSLRSLLPGNVRFETEICYKDCPRTNVPDNVTVVVFDYYLSGFRDYYNPEKVRMWMWRSY